MPADGLQLNIGAAQADLDGMRATGLALNETKETLKSTAMQLFNGALLGTGADTGTDFSIQIDAAMASVNDVITRCQMAVQDASSKTQAYDNSGFASTAGFA